MWLILGLGNPGREYEQTPHNLGFMVIERLANRHGFDQVRVRHRAKLADGRIGSQRAVIAQPMTYVNLSGEAARPLMRYHGVDPENLIVVHDEADLEPGVVRVKQGGGLAGHNGLESIADHLATRDFARVRIGIGRPSRPEQMTRHVLKRLGGHDKQLFDEAIDRASDAVEEIVELGVEAAMRRFNRREPRQGNSD